jgi:hypothetical protein
MKGKLAVVVFSDKVRELITKREACYDEWGKCLAQVAFFDRDFRDHGGMCQ